MTSLYGKGLRTLSILTAVTLTVAFALVFFWVPTEADQGVGWNIFYVHVPMALVALGGFTAAGVMGFMHLRSGDRRWDLRSYVAIHLSLVLAIGVLVTGAIWARSSWGAWWRWDEPMLVAFLVLFLLYATYQPLRFAIEDPERQTRYASVFAIIAGAFVPVCFASVRFAQDASTIHPRTFDASGSLPGPVLLTFFVALAGMTLLWLTLWKYEMASKHARMQVRALRRRLVGDRPVITA